MRVVFIIRLSAIGDIIIASHVVKHFFMHGYYPVFVTSTIGLEIKNVMPDVDAIIVAHKNKELEYYLKSTKVTLKEFENYLNSLPTQLQPITLDLQKTARSKRALKQLKQIFLINKTYTVPKKTFYRIFLIIKAFFCFTQKQKAPLNLKMLTTITNWQLQVANKIMGPAVKPRADMPVVFPPPLPNFGNYICLLPGASGFIKMWPKENFRDLINMILEKTQFNVVLCGSAQEMSIGQYLNFPSYNRVFNLINKTSLQETLALIANGKYVVTNDSFGAHAAQLYNVPATVIFGPTSPKFGFAPKAHNIKIEYLNLNCSPCTRHGASQCRFQNLACLKNISAQDVFTNIAFTLPLE